MGKKIAIYLINKYRSISSLTPQKCRFYPSCSSYTLEAIEKYGVLKGGMIGFYRLLRCNPWNPGGYDPVK